MAKVYVVERFGSATPKGDVRVYSTLALAKASVPDVTWGEDKYGWFVGIGSFTITEAALDEEPPPGEVGSLFEAMFDASQEESK